MNIYLGNLTFEQTQERTGYKFTDSDKDLWDKYQNDNADLSGKESSFHVFDMPLCIRFRGDEAKKAIYELFSREKLIEAKGRFNVYEV